MIFTNYIRTRSLLVALSALACVLGVFTSVHAAEYLLQKDDTLRMTIFQEEDLDTQAQIGKSGAVSFPLIGNVEVVGLTVKQAEEKIKKLYEKEYLVSAQVSLTVMAYAEKWVIVGGEVRQPGTIPFPEDGALDLAGAVAQAGGLMETANAGHITVRQKGGGTKSYSLAGGGNVVLKHGDSVTVGRSALDRTTITVSGQVTRPGVLEFPKAGSMDILTAIAQAGGFTRIANTKACTVRRGTKQYTINLRDISRGTQKMFYTRPGDIIIILESRF